MKNVYNPKKVSVIIPTYNRAEFLRSSIKSALDQTFKDIEIIVIDDNSIDHTHEVVISFKDERIKYLKNTRRKGPSGARNTAILASTGKYVAFLDDDDEWLPYKLEKQIGLLDNSLSIICGIYSNRLMINKLTRNTFSDNPGTDYLQGNLLAQLLIKNPIHTSTLVLKKSCIDEIGLFDENMRYMEDRDMWIRLSMKWDFEYIPEPLTKAYFHGQSHLSHNIEGQTTGREVLLKRYKHLFKKSNRKNWSTLYLSQGIQYCQLKIMSKGLKNIFQGIMIYPFRTIAYLHLFSALLGPNNYQRVRKFYKTIT